MIKFGEALGTLLVIAVVVAWIALALAVTYRTLMWGFGGI